MTSSVSHEMHLLTDPSRNIEKLTMPYPKSRRLCGIREVALQERLILIGKHRIRRQF